MVQGAGQHEETFPGNCFPGNMLAIFSMCTNGCDYCITNTIINCNNQGTVTAVPSQIETATIEPTPRPVYVPPTLIPTIDPTLVPGLLSKAFSIQTHEGLNAHTIQHNTGWDHGYGGGYWYGSCSEYYWLDTNHLLLYPSIGQTRAFDQWGGTGVVPQPVVINTENGHVWLPPANQSASPLTCNRVYWSPELGFLITSEVHNNVSTVTTYTYDGHKQTSYRGGLWDVSPSGTKIGVAEDTILDLRTNKKIRLVWPKNDRELRLPRLYWNDDETRIYRCCYYFGHISTGKSYSFEMSELQGTGARPSASATHGDGQWVRNGDYFLIEWSVVDDGYPDFFPMFDPAAKKYYEVSEMAGIPQDWTCVEATASPDGMYLWLECWEGSYLINLETFTSVAYPNYTVDDIEWSNDGNFAWVKVFNTNLWQILSVTDKELRSLLVNSIFDTPLWWHPTDDVLAYISEDTQKLELLDAQTMSAQEIALPTSYRKLVWGPNGKNIVLIAEDGSIWQVDYPKLVNLEQLTQPMSDVRDVLWSPDGQYIAFVSGTDIYIVDTNQ
jgi:WD40 repeat protein